jgi:hypothetical protein
MGRGTADDPSTSDEDRGSRLMKVVEAIAITPIDARAIVENYRKQVRAEHPAADHGRRRELIADKIVSRYARLAGTSGAATGLTAIIPGIGTAAAALGGGLADTAVTIKLQIDMCLCLADAYDYDVHAEDVRQLVYLVSLGGALEKAGTGVGVQIASKAGMRMLRQYLRGAALQFVKELFKRVGIVFSRKALEKALPFGIGVVIGGGANYAMTSYVGAQARSFFKIDREENG